MKFFIKLIITGVFLFGIQSSEVLASEFRVVALSQIDGLAGLEFSTEDGIEKVPVSTSSFSKSYMIPVSGRVEFYDKYPKGIEEAPAPLFTVQFSDESMDMIVLLQADPSSRQYSYILIPDSLDTFPLGSVLVMNFTRKSVYAKFGEDRVKVSSGGREVVTLAKQAEIAFNAGVKFAAEFDGYGKVFSSSSWYLLPSMKIFCIIYPDENGNPQIRRIRLT